MRGNLWIFETREDDETFDLSRGEKQLTGDGICAIMATILLLFVRIYVQKDI